MACWLNVLKVNIHKLSHVEQYFKVQVDNCVCWPLRTIKGLVREQICWGKHLVIFRIGKNKKLYSVKVLTYSFILK